MNSFMFRWLRMLVGRIAVVVSLAMILLPSLSRGEDWRFAFDPNGNLLSQTATASGAPQILSHPQPQTVAPGELASFFVVVAETRGVAYQWLLSGNPVSGATGDALLLTNVSAANQGQYSVVVANSSGSVTSAPAALMIDSDRDGLADSWETTYFANLNQTASGDQDGDGVSNGDEFRDGTNPTNSASAFFRLNISRDGGVVSVSPTKLNYTNGEIVTITATPDGSEIFHGWTGDALGTNQTIQLTMSRNRSVFAHFSYYTITFTNTAGGDWHSVLNWSPNLVPAMGDQVSLTLTGSTVTNNSSVECAGLILGAPGLSPSITGSGTLTVHSNGLWVSGSMTGSGRTIIGSNATFIITNNASTVSVNVRTLENAGTIIWAGADNFNFQAGGAVITNRVGALFEVRNNGSFFPFPSNSRFDNAGTFRKSLGTGTTTFAVHNSFGTAFLFNNYGTTEIQAGTLLCSATCVNNGALTLSPGTTMRIAAGGSASGTFNNSAGALVEWAGGSTFTVSAGALLGGSGLYKISGGTVTINPDLAVQNLDLNATLDGSGRLTVNNVLNWTAGTMGGSGRTIIAPGATNYINNNASGVFLSARTLENAGTIIWAGADNFNFQAGGAVITNRAGALFEVRNNGSFFPFPSNSRFDNAGAFRKSLGTGTSTFAVHNSFGTAFPFNNYGTTEIQAGTLLCSATCVNNGALTLSPGTTMRIAAGGSASGTFNNPAGALVEWTGGSAFTVSAGALVGGSGLYKISGGTVTLNTDLAVQNLDLNATLDGSGGLTVNNVLNWTGGTMGGSGRTIIAPGATSYINNNAGTVFLSARTLENAGTIIWAGADNFNFQAGGAVITNRAGALFEVRNNGSFFPFPSSSRFDNAGTFRKSLGTGTTTFAVHNSFGTVFPFNNYGTLDIRHGIIAVNGAYTFAGGALLKSALGGTTAGSGYGQLRIAGTATLNGGLSVDLLPGFVPATNDVFTVVSAGTRNGAFTSFLYPSNVVAMQLTNTTTSVILRVTDITLTNGAPVIINDLPVSHLFYDGRTFSLSTRVAGGQPFTFQWQKDGTDLTNSARIAGANSDALIVTNALRGYDSGNYRLLITNSEGSATTRVSTVTLQAVPKLNAAGAGWSLQGTTVPPMNSNNVTLTSGLGSTARSVFYNAPLYTSNFTAQFVYVDVGGGGADGITFCLQNDPRGASALGGGGGGQGYAGITPSAALVFNIYQPNTRGIAIRTNGTLPSAGGYTPTTPVNLASGNPIHVSLLYTGAVLHVMLTESNTANVYSNSFPLNLPATVGGETAYVGFTGADGGVSSTQVVSNFTYVPITGIDLTAESVNQITLSWPASIGGYVVQSNPDLNHGTDAWKLVSNTVHRVDGRSRVSVEATNTQDTFRLLVDPAK